MGKHSSMNVRRNHAAVDKEREREADELAGGSGRADRRPASLQRDQSRVSEDDDDIHVIKRNGKKEVVRYDKITSRIKKLCYGLDSKYIKPNVLTQRRE